MIDIHGDGSPLTKAVLAASYRRRNDSNLCALPALRAGSAVGAVADASAEITAVSASNSVAIANVSRFIVVALVTSLSASRAVSC